nr:hypothetical protein Iba_chr11aCG7970 [Ipomoea batatas]
MSLPEKSVVPNDPAAAATSMFPPMDVIRAESPGEGPPPAAIPNPRRSRVGCLGPNMEGVPNISSFKPEPPSQGRPSPRPAANDAPSVSICLPLHSCCPLEETTSLLLLRPSEQPFVVTLWRTWPVGAMEQTAFDLDQAGQRLTSRGSLQGREIWFLWTMAEVLFQVSSREPWIETSKTEGTAGVDCGVTGGGGGGAMVGCGGGEDDGGTGSSSALGAAISV